MVHCPECLTELEHVETELIDLEPSEELQAAADGGRAVASVCPECGVLLDL
ncbi:MAG: CpXC domain-containing protein [Haloglomus sp.]